MSTASNCIKKQVKAFCAEIGADPLLVQGAGGNVSWKDDDVLWVKASGTWLAEAESKEIFVPVNLAHLQDALAKRDFSVKPEVNSNSGLRPSIETLLHALLPAKIVLHLHPIDVLSVLVRSDCLFEIESKIGNSVNWDCLPYLKPGAELALGVYENLIKNPKVEAIFLANHGIIIGGDSIVDVSGTLNRIISRLKIKKKNEVINSAIIKSQSLYHVPIIDSALHQLALRRDYYYHVRNNWPLYPDHIVFLGHEANCYSSWDQFINALKIQNKIPDLVFVENIGVFVANNFGSIKISQLRCYYEIIIRQDSTHSLKKLSRKNIDELISWDAEKYRKSMNNQA